MAPYSSSTSTFEPGGPVPTTPPAPTVGKVLIATIPVIIIVFLIFLIFVCKACLQKRKNATISADEETRSEVNCLVPPPTPPAPPSRNTESKHADLFFFSFPLFLFFFCLDP
jgi:hypothetical protein